jgi:hypothetical protein
VLDGEARPAMAAAAKQGDPASAEGWPTGSHPAGSHPQTLPARLWSRFRSLPRPVRVVIVLVLFLFTINLFSGFETVWFHWPAAAGALFVFLWLSLVGHKKRQ